MKKKVIITSALTAALMLAGAVGGTFAWFTSESNTDVNITAGKVNISSAVSELKTYSLGVEQAAGKFENGGTALLEGQTITLDKMTPGDKATFKIQVTNNSDVRIKYRVAFQKTGALAGALKGGVTGGASGWTTLEVGSEAINLDAYVEMLEDAGNEYQGKTGQVTVVVEAVQDNKIKPVGSVADFENAIANLPAEGGEVSLYLSEDITLSEVLAIPSNANITIYGDGDTKIKAASGSDRAINLDETENSTLTLAGVDIAGGSQRGISMWGTTNCTINLVDSNLENADYYAINVASENTGAVINIEGSNVKGWCGLNIWSSGTVVNVKDSVLAGVNDHSGTSNAFGTIVVNSGAQNVKVNLENCVVNSVQNGDQFQSFFDIADKGCEITSINTTYNYTRPGASQPESYASVEDILNYNTFIRFYGTTSNAYKGVGNASVQFDGDAVEQDYPFFFEQTFTNTASVTDITGYLCGERTALLAGELVEEGEDARYSVSNTSVNGKHFVMPDYHYAA